MGSEVECFGLQNSVRCNPVWSFHTLVGLQAVDFSINVLILHERNKRNAQAREVNSAFMSYFPQL